MHIYAGFIKAGQIIEAKPNNPLMATHKLLILSNGESQCNSDGEDWWIVWKVQDLETGKVHSFDSRWYYFNLIS